MTIQITIIGLGQIGASIGLALADRKDLLQRTGHDRESGAARQASKIGAVDKTIANLPASVRDADLVILSLPMDQIRETMEIIAEDLKEEAVVMDTGPVKEVVAAWAGELLPPKRYYVGLTPVINPNYLHGTDTGIEAARADLFRSGLIAISAPTRTSSEAIKLAADLTRLLGAQPMFADPLEMDGLMAATHLLPQLVGAALLNATVDQPGWREARKVAGRAYAEVTGPIVQLSEPKTLATSALLNRDNILRVMDSTIAALQAMRNDIDLQEDAALVERLEHARKGRERWWKQRAAGDFSDGDAVAGDDLPTSSDIFSRLLGFGRKRKPED